MLFDILILGSGPAGLSAALYAARTGFSCALLTGPEEGGKLIMTDKIENYPGVPACTGFELITRLKQQVLETGLSYKNETALSVNLKVYPFEIKTETNVYLTRTLIIATGSTVKWLGLPSEEKFKGKGISVCATCDGFFYKNKNVAIIGDGNTALYEATHLSKIAAKVTIVAAGNALKGEKSLREKVLALPQVNVLYNTQVLDFIGDNKLTHLRLKNNVTENTFLLPLEGCFEAIGFAPASQLFANQLDLTKAGYIQTNCSSFETNVSGIFACGDVQETHYRQAIIAAGSGAMAALLTEDFLGAETYPKNNPIHL